MSDAQRVHALAMHASGALGSWIARPALQKELARLYRSPERWLSHTAWPLRAAACAAATPRRAPTEQELDWLGLEWIGSVLWDPTWQVMEA